VILVQRDGFGLYLGASLQAGKVKLNGARGPKLPEETLTAVEMMERLRFLEAQAEEAYQRMYDARPGADLTACYSDAKEVLYDAIALARRLGLSRDAARLDARLEEIKTVFRRQFPA
jgi:hypothetical protein